MLRAELRRRRRLRVVSALLAVVAVAACVRASPVHVAATSPGGSEAAACRALIARLPARLDRRASRAVTPLDALSAAWGRPAITLRCGLPAVAHPVGQRMVSFGGVDGTTAGAVAWFEDAFDGSLWVTRTEPRLGVHIPASDGLADVLAPISTAALGR